MSNRILSARSTSRKTFRTHKAIIELLRTFRLDREYIEAAKSESWAYCPGDARSLRHSIDELWGILNIPMNKWSRAQRKLTGKPANLDEYLVAHNEEICKHINALEAQIVEMDRPRYDGAMRQAFDNAWASINALWTLDLLEIEEHEIKRTAPRPEPVESEQAKSVRELFEAMDALKNPWGTIPPKTPNLKSEKAIVALPELNADELIADIEAMLSGV